MILEDGTYAEGLEDTVPSGATIIDLPRPNQAHEWDGSKWVFQGFTPEEAMGMLRLHRNNKLSETDWWAVSDKTMTAEQTAYRKNLRDLPSTASPELDETGELTAVTWPTKPE